MRSQEAPRFLYGDRERETKSQKCPLRALCRNLHGEKKPRAALPKHAGSQAACNSDCFPALGLHADRRIRCTGGSKIGQSAFHMKDEDQKSAESTAKTTMAGSAQNGASVPPQEDPPCELH